MKILDVLNSPWAIGPDRYVQVRDIYLRHVGGEKISEDTVSAIEASIGRPLENGEQGFDVVGGAALIPVEGVIAGRMNVFSRISGGCSIELLTRDFRQAMADSSVSKIIFKHDSPGGVIAGIQDFAAEIFNSRGKKLILAWTNNQMCSASYWLAAACDGIYISNDTTQVGSIGVITSHTDISKQEEKFGVKTTPIYAGTYKALANKYEPLSKEGKASIQEVVDYLYSVFVGDVAKYRGVSEAKALSMADGKVFIGKQAVSAGLVDGIASLEDLIAGTQVTTAGPRASASNHAQGGNMGFWAEVTAHQKAHGCTRGAAIKAVSRANPAAHEEFVEGLKTSDHHAENRAADHGPAATAFESKVKEYQDLHDCSYGKAVAAVAKEDPETHAAWLAEINAK